MRGTANRPRLLVAGCAALLLTAGCEGSTQPGAGPSVKALTSSTGTVLEGLPATAAAAGDSLWVAGYSTGRLVRVSGTPGLHELTLRIGNAQAPQPGCQPGDADVVPMGSFLTRLCDLPSGVAVGAGSVWVGRNDQQAVVRLDPATGRAIATIAVGMRVFNIAPSASAVWAVSFQDNMVARIDPHTNMVSLRQALLHAPSGVLIADGSAWISTSGNATVVRLDATTGALQAAIPVGVQPLPLAAARGAIWVRCEQDSTIARIDPTTNRMVASIPVDPF